MISALGEISISAALLVCAAALFAAAGAFRFDSAKWLRAANWLIGAIAMLFTIAVLLLSVALLQSDFRLEYVASYTESELPWGYKLAALWAGQEGSLLLWAWLLAVLSFLSVGSFKRLTLAERAGASGTLAIVTGFFAALLLFAADPFAVFAGATPLDGRGLNPQLQDIGMILHPPVLFMGYSGFAVPFAVLIGVLLAGPTNNRWLGDIRRWLLLSWFFLTAGIIIGAWWAYVELGWGGYWAWDPVENASLLPWLTATALLHSIMVQQHRGMFKIWNAVLITASFGLCIFGTYITRGGVIDSVHAFAPSLVGSFFLVFLGLCVAGALGLLIRRWRALRPEHEMEAFISKEGAYFLGNILLVVMMLTTLIGTIWPIISSAAGSEPVTVKPSFYNRVVAPMGLALVALMAIGPVLSSGNFVAARILRALAVPAAIALVVTAVVRVAGVSNIWAIICVAITSLGTATVIVGFVTALSARKRSTGESITAAAMRLIDRDHRRYGGQIAHLGVMLLVIGVAASSLFSVQETFSLRAGESASLGRVDVTLVELQQTEATNFQAVEAAVEVRRNGELLDTLHPQTRFYNGWENEPNTEVAIRSSWKKDIYVSLAGWEQGGTLAAIQLRLNPGVLWIWIGGAVMGVGALFGMLPPLLGRTRTVRAERQAEDTDTETDVSVQPALSARADALEVAR